MNRPLTSPLADSACPDDCPSTPALEVEVVDARTSAGLWPNAAFPDRNGINSLTGADPLAPFGGPAFHDNRGWIAPIVAAG